MSKDKKDKTTHKGGGGKPKKPAPSAPPLLVDAATVDERRAARNVAKIREKLSTAMDDPQMREQIVCAMRSLMYEDKT